MLLQQIAREARRTKPEWKHGRDTSLDQRLDEVVEFFGASTRLEDITTKRVYEFVTALEARRGRKGSLSPKTIVQYTTNRPEMPWQRESRGRVRTLDASQEAALLEHLDGRNALCVNVLISTGLRPGKEFFQLRLEQIEPEWLRLVETKNGDAASVPIAPELSVQLRALVARGELPKQEEFYRAFKRAAALCGLPADVCPYALRHTVGTRLAKEMPAAIVQHFMRHRDYRTTQNYVHLNDADKLRAAAVLRAS